MPETGGAETAKTIRLKRPSEAATVKVTAKPKIAKLEEAGTAEAKAALNRTAKLDETAEGEVEQSDASATKRKTIRIKRPGGAEAPAEMTVARNVAPGGVPVVGVPLMAQDDEPHFMFPILAVASVLVVVVTIYMFSAQTFGRNICWTEYSYGAPDLELGWFGKIAPTAQ